jgi:hypothetical protein
VAAGWAATGSGWSSSRQKLPIQNSSSMTMPKNTQP